MISVGRERVELLMGERHLAKLDAIVDPLVVSDLATMVWAPHGHADAAARIHEAVGRVLVERKSLTHDLGGTAGTVEMTLAIIREVV